MHAGGVGLLFVEDLYGGNMRKAFDVSQEYTGEYKKRHIGEKQRHEADQQNQSDGHKAAELRIFLREIQFLCYHFRKAAREFAFFPEMQDDAGVKETNASVQHGQGRPAESRIEQDDNSEYGQYI